MEARVGGMDALDKFEGLDGLRLRLLMKMTF